MPSRPCRFWSAYRVRSLVLLLLATFATPAATLAQSADRNHWGISASVTPKWTLAKSIKDALFEGDGTIKGSEFTIGFVRGRQRGGDWGVSFVRKPFEDGSGEIKNEQECFNQAKTQCVPTSSSTLTKGVYLNGIEVHWFFAFLKRDRLQVGLNLAVGAASVKGEVITTEDGFRPVNYNPRTDEATLQPIHTVETKPATSELPSVFPLGKVEVQGAVGLMPGLKLTAAGGLNFPSVSARVGVVYLIGAK
jgi:hypothetical protein